MERGIRRATTVFAVAATIGWLLAAAGCAGDGPTGSDGSGAHHEHTSASENGGSSENHGPGSESGGTSDAIPPDTTWSSDGTVNGVNFYQKGLIATTWDTSTGGKMLLVDRVLIANYCKVPPYLPDVLVDFTKTQYGVAIDGASKTGTFTVDGTKVTAVFKKVASLNSSTGDVTWTTLATATSGTVSSTTSGNPQAGSGQIAGTFDLTFSGGKLKGSFSGTLCWAEIL
jgi:hypothetical protein